MNVYKCLLGKVGKKGSKFKIDLEKRNVICDGIYLIKNGSWIGELGVPSVPTDEAIEIIEDKYHTYKYSFPSERSVSKRRRYFKSLLAKEMTTYELSVGGDSELAQADLEMTVLGFILNGSLTWDEKWGSWFWQSKKDKDLIILRKWV